MSTTSKRRRDVVVRLVEQSGGRLILGDDPRLRRESKRNVPADWPRSDPDRPTDSVETDDTGSAECAEPNHDH